MIAYKLFRIKKTEPGKIFPLFVLADEETPMGVWVDAKAGPKTPDGKVRSKLGPLCYRPGWHLSDIPLAVHIGVKGDSGEIEYMHPDHVWCECEYSDHIDYQDCANKKGKVNGKFNARKAYLEKIPAAGYYRFKTSPMMLGEWIIAGRIKVNRILSDEEVAEICRAHGYEPLPRK
jgi:hypothetical protein